MRILRTDSHFRPTAKSGRATASKLLRQTKNKDGIKYTIYKYDLFPDERTNHFGNSRLALQLSALKNITDALRNSRYLRPEIRTDGQSESGRELLRFQEPENYLL